LNAVAHGAQSDHIAAGVFRVAKKHAAISGRD
jgi:hypothetical protein